MQEDEKEIRKKLNFLVLYNVSPALRAFPPEEPLLLGEDFTFTSERFFERLNEFRSQAVKHLMSIPLDVLTSSFSKQGKPITAEQQDWHMKQRADFHRQFPTISQWLQALIERDRTFARYDYWGKAAYLSMDEALWLSVGLEPLKEFASAIEGQSSRAGKADPVVEHMKAERELLRRSLGIGQKLNAHSILTWINSVGHDVHPGFRRMLETVVRRTAAAPSAVTEAVVLSPSAEVKRIDPRERQSMAKLLVTIAIDAYGFDPKAKRSPIPKELEGIAARLGLEITDDTIRSYLRLGAEQLPKD
jgi:hypothetical protein